MPKQPKDFTQFMPNSDKPLYVYFGSLEPIQETQNDFIIDNPKKPLCELFAQSEITFDFDNDLT